MGALDQYLVGIEKRGEHLCPECQRNILECPWLHFNEPVEGWEAKKVCITRNKPHEYGYCVSKCPLYIAPPEKRMKSQAIEERKAAAARSFRTFY